MSHTVCPTAPVPTAPCYKNISVEDVIALDQRGYNPMEFYQKSSNLRRCLDQIRAGLFSPKQPDLFSDFIDNLLKWDRFKVCADFDSYIECQKEVSKLYMVCCSPKTIFILDGREIA